FSNPFFLVNYHFVVDLPPPSPFLSRPPLSPFFSRLPLSPFLPWPPSFPFFQKPSPLVVSYTASTVTIFSVSTHSPCNSPATLHPQSPPPRAERSSSIL
ncbi:unnamed protein product, partial [Brassica oleracea var. botrytis]